MKFFKHFIFVIGLLSLIGCSTSTNNNATVDDLLKEDWANLNKYKQLNDAIKYPVKAVFMGDSITQLWAEKDPLFFTNNNYVGRGISGQCTSHMLVRFQQDVINLKPKYVVILAGTNDIALNKNFVSKSSVIDNIKSMAEIAKQNDIEVILCSILPVYKYDWRPELNPAKDIIQINSLIKKYALLNNIIYVDFHSFLKDKNNGLDIKYSEDGVHPNINGFKIMESIISPYF